ncbi:MAG: hypothetical protein OEL84_10025 [Nitrosopumilus sp.]|nr:hypothetical protein [Nitrosopumilus sp.]
MGKLTADYNELTGQVLNLYPHVKFAGIVNVKGEIVAGGHKENVDQLLVGDEVKMSIHYSIQKRDLYTNLAYKIGKEKSAITEFQKAAIISIPINSNELFLVRTDKGIDYLKIIDYIYSKLDPQKYIREEIKVIRDEIEKLKKINENMKLEKKSVVKRKPVKETTAKKKEAKRKPVKETTAKKKEAKRKPVKETTAKKKEAKRKPVKETTKSKRKTPK